MWTDEEAGRMNKIRNWLSKYSVELMVGIFLLYSDSKILYNRDRKLQGG